MSWHAQSTERGSQLQHKGQVPMSCEQLKRNLVIVRAGSASLHEKWLVQDASTRNYDVVVSCFSRDAFDRFNGSGANKVLFTPGGKWDGIFKTFSEIDVDQYDYFWLPDDDIDADQADINKIFEVSARYGLRVSQPALKWGSFYSHLILHRAKSFILRYTNFVEVMVPCLHRDVLREILPFFEETQSGFGLDYIWCRLSSSGAFTCGVIDQVAVLHTRPLGAELQRNMASAGKFSPRDERTKMNNVFGITTVPTPIIYAGIRSDGEPITGRVMCGLRISLDYWQESRGSSGINVTMSAILKHLRRQATKRLSCRPLQWH